MARMTQRDLANRLGVSQPTVSLVVNDPRTTRVSPKTKERILRAVGNLPRRKRLGGQTGNIGYMVVENTADYEAYYQRYFVGIEGATSTRGRNVVLLTANGGPVSSLPLNHLDGLIVLGSIADSEILALARRLPIVLLDHQTDSPVCDMVMPDNIGAFAETVDYLHGKGHTNIALFQVRCGQNPEKNFHMSQRNEGYYIGLRRNGLRVVPEYVPAPVLSLVNEPYVVEAQQCAQQTLDEWIRLPTPPSAVVVTCDVLALCLIKAAAKLGVRVPDDLSVVGFDNLPTCDLVTPALTSVDRDMETIGKVGTELLIGAITRHDERPGVRVVCPTKLIERESVRELT